MNHGSSGAFNASPPSKWKLRCHYLSVGSGHLKASQSRTTVHPPADAPLRELGKSRALKVGINGAQTTSLLPRLNGFITNEHPTQQGLQGCCMHSAANQGVDSILRRIVATQDPQRPGYRTKTKLLDFSCSAISQCRGSGLPQFTPCHLKTSRRIAQHYVQHLLLLTQPVGILYPLISIRCSSPLSRLMQNFNFRAV